MLFLSELVYAAEQEHLVFDTFEIELKGTELKANMSGAPLLTLNKSIKAVTYHNLQIRQTEAVLKWKLYSMYDKVFRIQLRQHKSKNKL